MTAPAWRKKEEWKKICGDTKSLFDDAKVNFVNAYGKYIAAFSVAARIDQIHSEVRYDEFIRSCTDDLYRYATYHPVKKENECIYRIQESVRASYITKWFLIFKPLILDAYKPLANMDLLRKCIPENEIEAALNFFRTSNEIFSIYFASAALKLKKNVNGEILLLTEFFDININLDISEGEKDKEYKDFIYTLRYRLSSQDVYRPIYRRLETMSL